MLFNGKYEKEENERAREIGPAITSSTNLYDSSLVYHRSACNGREHLWLKLHTLVVNARSLGIVVGTRARGSFQARIGRLRTAMEGSAEAEGRRRAAGCRKFE